MVRGDVPHENHVQKYEYKRRHHFNSDHHTTCTSLTRPLAHAHPCIYYVHADAAASTCNLDAVSVLYPSSRVRNVGRDQLDGSSKATAVEHARSPALRVQSACLPKCRVNMSCVQRSYLRTDAVVSAGRCPFLL